ncbi:hypothetical protein [Mycobacterium haemophilum]
MNIDSKTARAYPVGQLSSKARVSISLTTDRRELCGGAKNDKFAEFDAVSTQLVAEFVQDRLYGGCFGDGVSPTFCWHNSKCYTSATPRCLHLE